MRRRAGSVLLSLGAICFVVALIEVAGHALVAASPLGYGRFLGRELPPFRVVPACDKPPAPADPSAPYRDLVVDGQRVTVGDLHGLFREDPALGYAPRENAVSANGWWQSDNVGARERNDAAVLPAAGSARFITFGESFGAGSRVKQEQVWSAVLARALPDTEVLNFAVDGYSMAQAYLRFLQLRQKIKYDVAVMVFVPKVDPPRDVNIFRPLLSREWQLYTVLPRYVIDHGALALVQRPDETEAAFIADNCGGMSNQLRARLAAFDRFYIDAEYRDGPPILGRSLLYKLGVESYANFRRGSVAHTTMRENSEALRVSKSIFWQMDQDVRRDGGKFVLVLLPLESELEQLGSDTGYRTRWRGMVAALCGKPLLCIDLADDLPNLPAGDIDRGYDGTHYGPTANRLIGQFVAGQLLRHGVIASLQKIGHYQR
jgi:hypothetical protein